MLALLPLLPLGMRPVSAQAEVRLASLRVSLWPEFDQPATLVILDGQLDPAVPLPASLGVRLPARAGQPHAVAVTGAGGQLLTAAHTTQPAGDDIIVLFQTQSPGFRVEYYDPALAVEGEARQYAFDWQTDYAIANAVVRVQEPAGARDLAGEPALTALGAGEDGLNYHELRWGALQAGERLSLRLSYAKAGSTLTAQTLSSAPVPQTITPQAEGADSLPWVVGGTALGLAAAAGGIYAYTHARRRVPARAAHRPRRARGMSQSPRRPVTTPAAGFCTQCGQARVAGDRFCRSCGARLAAS